ncbi:hypothetical protein AQUCO_01000128v1 [Aquilegia coerulea]|uniref:Uncharacterized protein n=1 Tax=Aquilegia coerulea TaxID=218851 RepID=A0A2G5E8F6_AQUCA|nr:hypothetical protein AQUCO_01000128v1 [Aquilegia coerulea]
MSMYPYMDIYVPWFLFLAKCRSTDVRNNRCTLCLHGNQSFYLLGCICLEANHLLYMPACLKILIDWYSSIFYQSKGKLGLIEKETLSCSRQSVAKACSILDLLNNKCYT